MEPFTDLTAVAAPLDLPNIDTDQIVPARFLRNPRSAGYHNWLFHDLRSGAAEGAETFVLDRPAYRDARIIVAAENFGCGSSREGAVWAIRGSGIRAVIAPSFGDIFSSNAPKNGLLLITLPAATVSGLRRLLHESPGAAMSIDLARQSVTAPDGASLPFEIDGFRKQCLLTGKDDVEITLDHAAQIEALETLHARDFPWLVPDAGHAGGGRGLD